MSQYAVQAVISAAADNDDLQSRLQNADTFEAAVAEVLAITDEEKSQLQSTMMSEDDSAPVMEEAEERNNPGPGTVGSGISF